MWILYKKCFVCWGAQDPWIMFFLFAFYKEVTWISLIRGRNSFPFPRKVCFFLWACISSSRLKNSTILCYSFEPWLHLLARQHFCMDLWNLVNKPVISSSLTQLLGRFFLKRMGTLRDHAIQIKAPCGVSHSSFGISF